MKYKKQKNNKIYYQDEPRHCFASILYIVLVLFGMLFSVTSLVISIVVLCDTGDIISSRFFLWLLLLFGMILNFPPCLQLFRWIVRLDEERIWMNGDLLKSKTIRIQYFTEIKYDEIVSIYLESGAINSKGERHNNDFYKRFFMINKFLCFKNTAGEIKRIYVSHYLDTTLANIVEDIISHIKDSGNTVYDGETAANIVYGNKHP